MFGLEILDVVIGLSFVYLVLSLIASAINEYIAATLNKRGKELAKGIGRLLEEAGGKEALDRAMAGLTSRDAAQNRRAQPSEASLTEAFFNHPLIRPLKSERGGMSGRMLGKTRMPSYIPARTFALALMDTLGYKSDDAAHPMEPGVAPRPETTSSGGTATPQQPVADLSAGSAAPQQPATNPASGATAPAQPATNPAAGAPPASADPADPLADRKAALAEVMALLKKESAWDVNKHLADVRDLLGKADLPDNVKLRLVDALTASQTRFQKLQNDVEVWFNNAMDRVSGSYKRHTQMMLFWIGLAVAVATNADTIGMWRQLSASEELREAMATRAAQTLPALETLIVDTTQAPNADSALAVYHAARAQLDSTELQLGWSRQDALTMGFLNEGKNAAGSTVYTPQPWPFAWSWGSGAFWEKLLGLLITGIALSLGAPFWFDVLNKIISVRAAGRSPEERAKSPEGPPKRAAEAPTK